jgi:hypothetical protein
LQSAFKFSDFGQLLAVLFLQRRQSLGTEVYVLPSFDGLGLARVAILDGGRMPFCAC